MIDDDMNVYLIEVNTNPCLDTSPCPLLQRLITQVLDQTFKIAVDPFLAGRDVQYAQALEMSLTEINYEMLVSNQPEIVGKYQSPSPATAFSSTLNIPPSVNADMKPQKTPSMSLSPIQQSKQDRKPKMFDKKHQSKDTSHLAHAPIPAAASKGHNANEESTSRHSSCDILADDLERDKSSERLRRTRNLRLPEFKKCNRDGQDSGHVPPRPDKTHAIDSDLIDIYQIQKKMTTKRSIQYKQCAKPPQDRKPRPIVGSFYAPKSKS